MKEKVEFPNAKNRIILSLDEMNPNPGGSGAKALRLIESFGFGPISQYMHSVKVGSDFIMLYRSIISLIRDQEIRAFLDGKFFCDSNDLVRIAENIFYSGAKMFSVQAVCGVKAMEAVVRKMEEMAISKIMDAFFFGDGNLETSTIPVTKTPNGMVDIINKALKNDEFKQDQVRSAIAEANKLKPMIIADTMPLFLNDRDIYDIFGESPLDKFKKFLTYAKNSGLDGIICPSRILNLLKKKECLKGLFVIVPDTVPKWAQDWFSVPDKFSDKKRYIKVSEDFIMTPAQAIEAGASAVVLGSLLTDPPQKKLTFYEVLMETVEEIHRASREKENRDEIEEAKTILTESAKR